MNLASNSMFRRRCAEKQERSFVQRFKLFRPSSNSSLSHFYRRRLCLANYMKSEPTISTQKFISEMGRIYARSKQTIKHRLYLVKTSLDQVEIARNLPTYQHGIMITQKQYLAKVCEQTLFYCQG